MKKIRSAKGVLVDFDQLRVKQELAEKPSTTEVKARQDFIERRKRRRAARNAVKTVAKSNKTADNVESKPTDDAQPETKTRKQQTRKSKNDDSQESSDKES